MSMNKQNLEQSNKMFANSKISLKRGAKLQPPPQRQGSVQNLNIPKIKNMNFSLFSTYKERPPLANPALLNHQSAANSNYSTSQQQSMSEYDSLNNISKSNVSRHSTPKKNQGDKKIENLRLNKNKLSYNNQQRSNNQSNPRTSKVRVIKVELNSNSNKDITLSKEGRSSRSQTREPRSTSKNSQKQNVINNTLTHTQTLQKHLNLKEDFKKKSPTDSDHNNSLTSLEHPHFQSMDQRSVGPRTMTLIECLNRIQTRHSGQVISKNPSLEKIQNQINIQIGSPYNKVNHNQFQSFDNIQNSSQGTLMQDELKQLSGISPQYRGILNETSICSDPKKQKNISMNLQEFSSFDFRQPTQSQVRISQLEEQLRLAYYENKKLKREIDDRILQINSIDEQLDLQKQQVFIKDEIISTLSLKFEQEQQNFKEKLQNALAKKDEELSQTNQRLTIMSHHFEELHKENDQINRDKLILEQRFHDIAKDRENMRRTIETLQTDMKDAQCQQQEYKNIIKRMSTTLDHQKLGNTGFHKSKTLACNKTQNTQELSDDRQSLQDFTDELENNLIQMEDYTQIIEENQKLKQKLELIQDMIISDKVQKQMKTIAIDILCKLGSIDEAINLERGNQTVNLTQTEFEQQFLKEVNDIETQVITIRDLKKIRKQVKKIYDVVIVPKNQSNQSVANFWKT